MWAVCLFKCSIDEEDQALFQNSSAQVLRSRREKFNGKVFLKYVYTVHDSVSADIKDVGPWTQLHSVACKS